MRPLIWSDRRAQIAVAVPMAWLFVIEAGTSRRASRRHEPDELGDVWVEPGRRTSRVFDASAVASLVVGVLASRHLPMLTIRRFTAALVAGVALLLGAGALSTWARAHLGRFHRDTLTRHADHELVETGPYRVVRHPLYTATIAVFVGIGAVLGNWLSVAAAMLPVAALRRRVVVEERMLTDEFGDTYRSYRRRAGRFLPRLR